MLLLAALLPAFPLLGFLILGLGFRRIPKNVTSVIGSGTVFLSFTGSLALFIHLILLNGTGIPCRVFVNLFNWISFSGLTLSFSFLIDPLSVIMMLVITGVGFLIHVYSVGYMKDDPGYNRFFAFMNLFIFFMLLLVMGAGYVIMFIGWEGVGLCSYLLIGFWFKNQDFNNAAKKAFIMNRIGDLGFLLGIFLIFNTFKSLDYSVIFPLVANFHPGSGVITVITLLLFAGAIGKSAQIPLYTWLPDAMAGPTPVSALIHAATMVTAGVYMVARSNILFALAPATLLVVAITGLTTAIFAGLIAIYQNDIKKILAYSTISQLGYMFLALGVGAFTGAIFHLVTHAFFKALLFLAAGNVIHAMGGEQDIRNMGGLSSSLKKTHWIFLMGVIAITGLPPLSGFFSKDEILSGVFTHNILFWLIAVFGVMITSFYMFRLYFLTFQNKFKGSPNQKKHLHDSPSIMIIPLVILAVLSIFGGGINLPGFIGGTAWLESFLRPVFKGSRTFLQPPVNYLNLQLEWMLAVVGILYVTIMIFVAYHRLLKGELDLMTEKIQKSFFRRLIFNKFYIDELYDRAIVRPLLRLSEGLSEFIEKKIIDKLVEGMGTLVIRTGNTLRYLQTGHVGFYVFMMVAGILAILLFNLVL
jgi:NADH-quinone oxidoreductase subunit L